MISTRAASETDSHTGSWAAAAEPLWSNQSGHPFVAALGRGDLPIEKFRFSIRNVDRMIESERMELQQVFLTAVRHEWLFWEMARTLRGWPGEE